MTRSIEAQQIETTRGEKLLAFVLAAFMLVGGLWIYFHLDDIGRPSPAYQSYQSVGTPQDRSAINQNQTARMRLNRARAAESGAQRRLELKRETYRTALDANQPAASLKASYDQAQQSFSRAQTRTRVARQRVAATQPAATAAQQRLSGEQSKTAAQLRDEQRSHDRQTFVLRLLYVILTIAAGYWMLGRVRQRYPRYLAVALAFVGFGAAQALVMAGDYTTDYIGFAEMGPLAISVAGILMTLVAFVSLQRYIAKRLPKRRVRRRECPYCGFPVVDTEHCEGCGRQVFGDCARCNSKRRVGTAHCGVCGAA